MNAEIEAESEAFERICKAFVEHVLAGDVGRDNLEFVELDAYSGHSSPKVPKNTGILQYTLEDCREKVKEVVQRRPVRTASGVSPAAIMTSLYMHPYGKCLYCPGGPANEFSSSWSYTNHESTTARGVQNNYNLYGQVALRLKQPRHIGHPVDKIGLILTSGTATARSHDYQEWFVERTLEAMSDYDLDKEPELAEDRSFKSDPEDIELGYIEDIITENETNDIRNIGTAFETEPD